MQAVIIPADNEQPVRVQDIDGSLKELQGLVGGYLQPLHLSELGVMYMDEEGKFKKDAAVNTRAMLLLMSHIGLVDIILGDVVILGAADGEGNDTGVAAEAVARIQSIFEAELA